MRLLNFDNSNLMNLSKQLNTKHPNPLLKNCLDALDDTKYCRYINTLHLISELYKRLNDLETYFTNNCSLKELELKMQLWTTDLYDKSGL